MVLSVLKCFKWKLYRCICWLIVEVILRNARCNDEIHAVHSFFEINILKKAITYCLLPGKHVRVSKITLSSTSTKCSFGWRLALCGLWYWPVSGFCVQENKTPVRLKGREIQRCWILKEFYIYLFYTGNKNVIWIPPLSKISSEITRVTFITI